MSRRLPQAERRALILDAAGERFGADGYDATRLDDIAAAAGVTKPVLYRHFASKQHLYLALLERHAADLPSFTTVVDLGDDPETALHAALDRWFSYVESRAYAWRMLFRDRGGGSEVQAARDAAQREARAVLMRVIAVLAGDRIPEPEREPLAELMRSGMASLVLWWTDEPTADREAVVGALTRAWLGLMRP